MALTYFRKYLLHQQLCAIPCGRENPHSELYPRVRIKRHQTEYFTDVHSRLTDINLNMYVSRFSGIGKLRYLNNVTGISTIMFRDGYIFLTLLNKDISAVFVLTTILQKKQDIQVRIYHFHNIIKLENKSIESNIFNFKIEQNIIIRKIIIIE